MEFIPICLECEHFRRGNKCRFFELIPHKIKNREEKCPYFSGGDYELFTSDAYPNEDNQ